MLARREPNAQRMGAGCLMPLTLEKQRAANAGDPLQVHELVRFEANGMTSDNVACHGRPPGCAGVC